MHNGVSRIPRREKNFQLRLTTERLVGELTPINVTRHHDVRKEEIDLALRGVAG